MFCQECGKQHSDMAKFCPNCGSRIETVIVKVDEMENEDLEGTDINNNNKNDQDMIYSDTYEKIIMDSEDESISDNAIQSDRHTNNNNVPDELNDIMTENKSLREGYISSFEQKKDIGVTIENLNASMADVAPLDDSSEEDIESLTQYKVWHDLIGDNSSYYVMEFKKIAEGETSFNWMAFFFSGILMLYRKMYGEFVKYFGLFTLLMLATCFVSMIGLSTPDSAYMLAGIAMVGILIIYWFILSFVAGRNFNRNYFKHIQGIIINNDLNKSDDLEILERLGGTSIIAVAVVVILIFILLVAMQFLGVKIGVDIRNNLI